MGWLIDWEVMAACWCLLYWVIKVKLDGQVCVNKECQGG